MSKTFWASLACVSLFACNDASIGQENCIVQCDTPRGLQAVLLRVSWTVVSTESPADLPVQWRVPSPCATTPCPLPIQLARASGDAVWTVPRDRVLPALDTINAMAQRTSTIDLMPPPEAASLEHFYLTDSRDGRALTHMQWRVSDSERLDEIRLVREVPNTAPLETVDARTMSRNFGQPPLGITATGFIGASTTGFLLFDGATGRSVVKLISELGLTVWQQTAFPSFASSVGSSAIANSTPAGSTFNFVLGASDGNTRAPAYGLLYLDLSGKLTQFAHTDDSRWKNLQLLSLANGAFAAAAGSELLVTPTPGAGDGNIDVLLLPDASLALTEMTPLSGFRISKYCYQPANLNGFTADEKGNLYVSTLTGTQVEPRGMLCRLPVSGVPRCYQAQPNVLLGQIVATSENVVYAAANDEIIRVVLPP